MGRNDRSALNHWLTDSGWSEEKMDKAGKAMVLEGLQARGIRGGVLVVDDTINHEAGKHMEGVSIQCEHTEGRYVPGLVTSNPAT